MLTGLVGVAGFESRGRVGYVSDQQVMLYILYAIVGLGGMKRDRMR